MFLLFPRTENLSFYSAIALSEMMITLKLFLSSFAALGKAIKNLLGTSDKEIDKKIAVALHELHADIAGKAKQRYTRNLFQDST